MTKIYCRVLVPRDLVARPQIFISDSMETLNHEMAKWMVNYDKSCNAATDDQTIWNFLKDNPKWVIIEGDTVV